MRPCPDIGDDSASLADQPPAAPSASMAITSSETPSALSETSATIALPSLEVECVSTWSVPLTSLKRLSLPPSSTLSMAVASRARRSANILGSESGSISTAPSAVPAGSRDDSEYDDTFAAEPACLTMTLFPSADSATCALPSRLSNDCLAGCAEAVKTRCEICSPLEALRDASKRFAAPALPTTRPKTCSTAPSAALELKSASMCTSPSAGASHRQFSLPSIGLSETTTLPRATETAASSTAATGAAVSAPPSTTASHSSEPCAVHSRALATGMPLCIALLVDSSSLLCAITSTTCSFSGSA
mmetsp:Transcript_39100/g.85942  ORF Transcript_39100/g.85942 Transcript_39100/m.85942 type:complete len:303 (+) Transcript_39100:2515-3423(+)